MLHIFYVFDIVANKNNRICKESQYYKIEKKTLLERIGIYFDCGKGNKSKSM